MPVFDHRIPMPLTEELVLKMKNFPLIISLWDKTGISQNDTLVGYCKLNLSSGYSIMVNSQNQVIVNQILLTGVSPFSLYNQYFPVTDLMASSNQGYLYVYLGIGTLEQISHYNEINMPVFPMVGSNDTGNQASIRTHASDTAQD